MILLNSSFLRFIALSLFLAFAYFLAHFFLGQSPTFGLSLFNFAVAFTYYFTLCLLWHVGEQSRWTRWLNILVSMLFLLPILQVVYFFTYQGFISTELFAMILREMSFLWEMVVTGFSWTSFSLGLLILTANYFLMRFILKIRSKGIDYLFLFRKWYILLLLLIVEIQQILWCLKRDVARLPERILLPLTLVFILSLLIRALRHPWKRWQKIVFVAIPLINIMINVLYSRPPFTKLRDTSTLDIRFFQSAFAAVYNGSPVKVLSPDDETKEKISAQPANKIDYNTLVILVDAMRFDSLGVSGYSRATDTNLRWFYQKAHIFNYAVAPANMTDTSVPTIFTGLGTNRDVTEIKNSFRLWDYFHSMASTFFFLTGDMVFANIDKFLATPGLDKIWSADNGSHSKHDIVESGDLFAMKELREYIKNLGRPYLGVWHADATHSYIKYPAPKEYMIFNRDTVSTEIEKRKVNYDNGVHFATSMISDLLHSIDLDKTVVVIIADHGEGFGEHGYYFHNQDYHQEAVRVPFIWHIPQGLWGKISNDEQRCFQKNTQNVVSLLDLLPTLLSLYETTNRPFSFAHKSNFEGKNLFECQPPERVVFSSHCLNGYRCYKRNILFANNYYSVLFDPKRGFEGIYSTFDDMMQKDPLPIDEVMKDSRFRDLLKKAKEIHPIGRMLDFALLTEAKGK